MTADNRRNSTNASADRELAAANLQLAEVKAGRADALAPPRSVFTNLRLKSSWASKMGLNGGALAHSIRAGLVVQKLAASSGLWGSQKMDPNRSPDLARTTLQLLTLAAMIGTSLWIVRPFRSR
jgi:hypothetical protein